MPENTPQPGHPAGGWAMRALLGGAVTAPFAYFDFTSGAPILTPAYQDPFGAVCAFGVLWLMLWGFYLVTAGLFFVALSRDEDSASDGLTVAVALGFSFILALLLSSFSGMVSTSLVLLVAVATPLLYRLLASMHPGPDTRRMRLAVLASFSAVWVAAGLRHWLLNYAHGSLEPGSSLQWVGLGALLGAAGLPALLNRKSKAAWAWTFGFVGLAAALAFTSQDSRPESRTVVGAPPGPASVIVITIDTLRADALSCYGSAGGETPNLSQLASQGALFRNVYSPASWTIPSMTSLFTGQTPLVHGVGLPFEEASLPTVAEYFSDAGYDTVGVFGNPVLSNLSGLFPNPALDAKFQFYEGFRLLRLFSSEQFGNTLGGRVADMFTGDPAIGVSNTTALAELAVRQIDKHAGTPFFLWAHFHDPHWPFTTTPEFTPKPPQGLEVSEPAFWDGPDVRLGTRLVLPDERKWVRALYQGEVRFVDQAVGRIVEALRETGAYENALIVVTSDHGEEFWEHGRFAHGHSLHRETVQVPLIFKLPGAEQRRVIERPVENRSLLPTLLDLAQIQHETQQGWAASLAPLVTGEDEAPLDRPVYTSGVELFENEVAVRVGHLRYIRRQYSGDEWLYDVEADPGETQSILQERPEEADRMRQAMDDYLSETRQIRDTMGLSSKEGESFDPETLKRLKSLGYL